MVLRIPIFETDQEPYAGFCGPNKKAGLLGPAWFDGWIRLKLTYLTKNTMLKLKDHF